MVEVVYSWTHVELAAVVDVAVDVDPVDIEVDAVEVDVIVEANVLVEVDVTVVDHVLTLVIVVRIVVDSVTVIGVVDVVDSELVLWGTIEVEVVLVEVADSKLVELCEDVLGVVVVWIELLVGEVVPVWPDFELLGCAST